MNTNRKIALIVTIVLVIMTLGNISYGINMPIDTRRQENTKSYTYDQLLDMALKNSRNLATQQKKVERSEIIQEEAARNKTYTPVGHGTTMEEAAASAALQGLVAANTGLAMARKQLDIEKDKIAYNVKKGINDLILAKEQVSNEYDAKEIAEMEIKHGNIKYLHGLISENESRMLGEGFKEASGKLDIAETQLENAYLKLNDLVGLNKGERYSVENNGIDDRGEIPSLEIHISRILNDNPSIWMLEQNAKLADISLNLYTYNVGLEPYGAKEIDAATSKMALGDAKQAFELSLRNLHHGLNQMKENMEILELNRDKLSRNLSINRLMLQEGMITPLEVKKLENTLSELEK